MMFEYHAYGLRFASELALPFEEVREGSASPEKADVIVRRGPVPQALGPEATGRGHWRAEPGRFLMHFNDNVSAIVEAGSEITVSGENIDAMRVFLTGSALTALLQQRHCATLHASAVLMGGGAVAFMGKSGAGKSTTAAAFLARGHALIADDVIAARRSDEAGIVVEPAFPRLCLWQETMDALSVEVDEGTRRVAGVDKFLTPFDHFHAETVPLRHLFLLAPEHVDRVTITRAAPEDVFKALGRYTHRKRAAVAQGVWPNFFMLFSEIANKMPVSVISRPIEGFQLEALCDAVEAHLGTGQD